ncbi:hypothetical protein IJ103_03280, partial [Candidatus Saccharibacteria bacterium]|nr:hypothetical protein [Candidatus Saccharibacteria bacterium]
MEIRPSDSIYTEILERLQNALKQSSQEEKDKLLESTLAEVGLTAHDLIPPTEREHLPEFTKVAQIIALGSNNIEQNLCRGWSRYRKRVKDLATRYQKMSDFIEQINSDNFGQLPQLARTTIPMRGVIHSEEVIDFPFQVCKHCRFAGGKVDKETNPNVYTKTGQIVCLLLERSHEDFLRRICGHTEGCVFNNMEVVNASKKYLTYVSYHYASMCDELSFRLEFVRILAIESAKRKLGHIMPTLETHQAPE